MSGKLKKLFSNFNQIETLLSYSVSVNDLKNFNQIIYYDGKKFNEDCLGIEFNFSKDLQQFIENDHIMYINEIINLNEIENNYWFLFEQLKDKFEKINVFVYKIYAPFINIKELLGIVLFFTEKDESKDIISMLEELSFELSEVFYAYRKNFLRIDYTYKFLNSILRMLKETDIRLYYHSLGVADTAVIIAEAIGYTQEKIEFIRSCGLIHDIGKISIPKSLLNKRGNLTKEEYELVKIHTNKLEEILSINNLMEEYIKIAKYHHEMMDGSGYYGLKNLEIPEEARILVIADIFDALTHERPYRDAFTLEQALDELNSMAEKGKIDKKILNAAKHTLPKIFSGDKISALSTFLVGKEVYIQDIIEKDKFIKGSVIETHKDVLNIFLQDTKELTTGKTYIMTYENNDVQETSKIKILSLLSNKITVKLEKYSNLKENYVKILWYKKINITKLPSAISNFETLNISKYPTFKVKMLMLGGNSLTIELEELIIKKGDILLVSFEAYDLKVRVLCRVTLIKENGDFIRASLDFFNMNDKQMRKIFQVIFKRQIELRLNY